MPNGAVLPPSVIITNHDASIMPNFMVRPEGGADSSQLVPLRFDLMPKAAPECTAILWDNRQSLCFYHAQLHGQARGWR
jgi:hypothetical protein